MNITCSIDSQMFKSRNTVHRYYLATIPGVLLLTPCDPKLLPYRTSPFIDEGQLPKRLLVLATVGYAQSYMHQKIIVIGVLSMSVV